VRGGGWSKARRRALLAMFEDRKRLLVGIRPLLSWAS
jgi:hypothetical protein